MPKRGRISFKIIAGFAIAIFAVAFLSADLLSVKKTQASVLGLPEPTQLLQRSANYKMPVLKGMRLDNANPFNMEFIVDSGDSGTISTKDSQRLIKYFLAALTTPDEDLWVNLSPYESDRVIPDELGTTDMGRDMLAQDYVLKQLSSSLTHPDTPLGKTYWSMENRKSKIENRNTFNKIWIAPDTVQVHEQNGVVLIGDARLKVMTEKDYLAASSVVSAAHGNVNTSDVVRDTIIPQIEDEVNSGKHFAKLRQIYHSIILAMWFKKKFNDSFYANYMDQSKVAGIELQDKTAKDVIFNLYCEAFKRGVYDIVKKEHNAKTGKKVKRSYFSGGLAMDKVDFAASAINFEQAVNKISTPMSRISVELDMIKKGNAASALFSKSSLVVGLMLLIASNLHALDLIKGTPNTVGILKDSVDAVKVLWDANGDPSVFNSKGAANQKAKNNPYDMASWGQFMNMVEPIDSIAGELVSDGHTSNKVYYAAEGLNPSDQDRLTAHTNDLFRDKGLSTMMMSFAGQYAKDGSGSFLLANPSPGNLEKVRENMRAFARHMKGMDPGAISGVQLFNEPMFYQKGASSQYWGNSGNLYAQINFATAEEFYDFANELAGIFKSICPGVPVYYGHGFLEKDFISKMKGRLSNFDAIALNLYPNFPFGQSQITLNDLIDYFRDQVDMAFNELGLPVVVGEMGESSIGANGNTNWGEEEQAEFAAIVIRALGEFMFGSDSDEQHAVIAAFWHELWKENWKGTAIGKTELGLSLYTDDYQKKIAADSLAEGYLKIKENEDIATPVVTNIASENNITPKMKIFKALLVDGKKVNLNYTFSEPTTVEILNMQGRRIASFQLGRGQDVDSYIKELSIPAGNYIIKIKKDASSALTTYQEHRLDEMFYSGMVTDELIESEINAEPTWVLDFNGTIAGLSFEKSTDDNMVFIPRPGVLEEIKATRDKGWRLTIWTKDTEEVMRKFLTENPDFIDLIDGHVLTADNFNVYKNASDIDENKMLHIVNLYKKRGYDNEEAIRKFYKADRLKDLALFKYKGLVEDLALKESMKDNFVEIVKGPAGEYPAVWVQPFIGYSEQMLQILKANNKETGIPGTFADRVPKQSSSALGGIDLADIEIDAGASSSIMTFAPFDDSSFYGLTPKIIDIEEITKEQILEMVS